MRSSRIIDSYGNTWRRACGYMAMACILFMCVALSAASIDDWSHIDPGSASEKGLRRSLKQVVPDLAVLSPDEVKRRADAAGGLEEYPNADAIILALLDRTAVDAEGYYHLVQQEAVKILTERGVNRYGKAGVNYGIPYSRSRILEAFIIDPSGGVHHLRPEDILDVADSSMAVSNIFEPIWRRKEIVFPGVEPGSVIYYRYEHCAVRPVRKGVFNWGHTFRGKEPIIEASCHIAAPSEMPIYWYVSNDPERQVAFQKRREGTRAVYCWDGGNLPMIVPESGMIPPAELETGLLVSNQTWREYSRKESELIEPLLEPDDAIRARVDELTRDCASLEEKQRVLFRYVTRKVRYLGVAYGDRPGVNPDPVTRTFANNAGVCKDKAGLLTAMLRLAGIEAYYTLNNPGRRIHPEVAVDQFNHAIVAARFPGESTFRYLDVTADLVRSQCPAHSGGTGVLRIMPDGADIDTIPIPSPEANTGRLSAVGTIDESGALASEVSFTGDGVNDEMRRGMFYYVDPSQYSEVFGNILREISPAARLKELDYSPKPAADLSRPLEIRMKYEIPDYTVKTGKFILFKIPGALSYFDWIYHRVQDLASVPERHYPLDIGSTSRMIVTETVRYPGKFRLKALPEPIRIDTGDIGFTQRYTAGDNAIELEQVFTVKHPRIPLDRYKELQRVMDEIKASIRNFVILEEKQ